MVKAIHQTRLFARFVATTGIIFLLLTLGSCGSKSPNSFIRELNWESTLVQDDLWLSFSAQFNMGSITFTSVQLPIYNPTDNIQYGSVSLRPTLDGYSEVETSLNLSACAQTHASIAKLPNGRELPIAGLNNVNIYQLNIDSIHSRIYLGLNASTVLFGYAISIQEFDQLSKSVGGMLNFFPGFTVKGIRGMLGFYTGVESYTSGLAFFVDLSALFSPDVINKLIKGERIAPSTLLRSVGENTIDLMAQTPSYKNKSSLKFPQGNPKMNERTLKALKEMSDKMEKEQRVELTPVQER